MAQLPALPVPLNPGDPENINDVVTNLDALRNAINGIDSDQINNGAVGLTELTANIVNSLVPVGTVLDWHPPVSAVAPWDAFVPSGYVVCDGRAWSTVVNDLGYTTGNVPNLIGKYTVGAKPSLARATNAGHSTSALTQSAPGVLGVIGSATVDQEAAPSVIDNELHQHRVANHQHGMDHNHGINNHRHGLTYKYGGLAGGGVNANWTIATETNDASGSTSVPLINGTFTHKPLTDPAGEQWTTLIQGEKYSDKRPASVGLLKIMKVRSAA